MAKPTMPKFTAGGRVFWTQLRALMNKNFLLYRREWITTLLSAYLLPLLVVLLILNVPNFQPRDKRGIGAPFQVLDLHSALPTDKDLVIVRNSTLGADVHAAVDAISKPLTDNNKKFQIVESTEKLAELCSTSRNRASPCFAGIVFEDSPLTKGGSGNWSYTLRLGSADISKGGSPWTHDNAAQRSFLPLSLAVHKAITNATDLELNAYFFTTGGSQEKADEEVHEMGVRLLLSLAFMMLFSFIPIVYITATRVARERNDGISQLVDSMGGGAVSRILASIIATDLIHLPTFLISGALCWHYAFRLSNAAILIFWWIFSGLAITHSTIFIAAFFRRGYVAGIVAVAIMLLLLLPKMFMSPFYMSSGSLTALGLLFPSTNFDLFLSRITIPTLEKWPIDMTAAQTPKDGFYHRDILMPHKPIEFFIFSIVQLLVYPVLAILIERWIHGISFKGRTFSDTPESQASFNAIQSVGLKKVYHPSIWRKIFCCACGTRGKSTVAVDGISLNAPKKQILALLGLNGSGKTTTMDLITGFQASNEGTVQINAPATQLGICPQKNVLYSELTVLEHVRFWSQIKGGKETTQDLHTLIEACDLRLKTNHKASSLSGGQKRKLQLACMFVGGSTVCLMDEVTTGLDPVSRRSIWNIILAERSRRSMIFTTHFLDEGEVLADHIVLLSKGQIKAQGTSAELKSQYGGGYSVHIPRPTDGRDTMTLGVTSMVHQDRVLYKAKDSAEAARLIAQLEAAGKTDIEVEGPTVENVFLKLADDVDPESTDGEDRASTLASQRTNAALNLVPGTPLSTLQQIKILFMKRLTILRYFWIAPLLALAIPIAVPPAFGRELLDRYDVMGRLIEPAYVRQDCPKLLNRLEPPQRVYFQPSNGYNTPRHALGPVGAETQWNKTLWTVLDQRYPIISPWYSGSAPDNSSRSSYSYNRYDKMFVYASDYSGFTKAVEDALKPIAKTQTSSYYTSTSSNFASGLYMGDGSNPPTLALSTTGYEIQQMFVLWASVQGQVKFSTSVGSFVQLEDRGGRTAGIWIWIAVAIFSITPALFALYPSYERTSKIRAVQYANGVRPLPLWLSHLLFELITVVLISVALTVTVSVQLGPTMWFASGYIFLIAILYNMAALLIAFLMSRLAQSMAGAFLYAMFTLLIMFAVAGVTGAVVPEIYSQELAYQQWLRDVLFWTLGLIFPQVSLWRSFSFGLNAWRAGCRDGELIANPGSIHAYGGPILLLIFQIIALTVYLVWLESSNSFAAATDLIKSFRNKRGKPVSDSEAAAMPGSHEDAIAKEAARVDAATANEDLLRLSHVSKTFGKNVAVDDVTLGLGGSEILALLGPNGAGKTTIANMIMGEMRPDSGHIYLKGTDVHRNTRLAQRSLGVCPQFDALDMMTMEQHLKFYAAVRGIKGADIQKNIDVIVQALGIGPHMKKAASKLSGGNKRKLSLAIAIIGSPDVLILDEPSSAMDALAKRRFWVMLEGVAPGRSVLLTTHSMEEADALATRVSIISKRMLAIGTTQQLRERYSNLYYVTLILRTAPESSPQEMAGVETWIRDNLPNATFQDVSLGGQVKFMIPNGGSAAKSNASSAAATPHPGASSDDVAGQTAPAAASTSVSIGRLIEILESQKEILGIQDYSIGSPTLERVFLSVMKENDVIEEDEAPKKAWWRP